MVGVVIFSAGRGSPFIGQLIAQKTGSGVPGIGSVAVSGLFLLAYIKYAGRAQAVGGGVADIEIVEIAVAFR